MPGGVCRDLSGRALAELARRWPKVDGTALNSVAKNYQLRLQHKAETPASLRKTMDELIGSASNLRLKLEALSEEADTQLWSDFQESAQGEVYSALPQILSRLQQAAMRGHNAEVGRDGRKSVGPRHQLVAGIAWQLQQAGMSIDKRPSGDLRRIVEIILDDLGESVGDLTATVRDALERMTGGDHLAPGQSPPH